MGSERGAAPFFWVPKNGFMGERRVPCLVESGFLGSGKTTLVRALLDQAQAEGSRVAFVSNELGELGVNQAMRGGVRVL